MKSMLGIVISILMLSLVQFGCKGGDGPTGPQGPAGPVLTGNVIGRIVLTNEDGTSPSNKSGVSVTVEGSSISATTDSTGKYTLVGLTTGVYNISYAKSGYGSTKQPLFQFVGGGAANAGSIYLDQIPGFGISTATAVQAAPNVTLSGTISNSAPYYRYILILIGKVNPTNTDPSSYQFVYSAYVSSSTTTFSTTLYQSYLTSAGFVSGDTLHITVYSYGSNFNSYYYDPSTQQYVFNAVGAVSKTVTVVMP